MSWHPFGVLLVLAIGGVRQLAGFAQVGDVPLSGALDDVERSGGFEVSRTVEGVGQGCQELLPDGIAQLPTAFQGGGTVSLARQRLKDG